MKCFYHRSDLDGKCSAAIVKKHSPKCEMFGIQYGEEFPWHVIEQDEIVVLVDFCLEPFSDMIKLNDLVQLIWIDHHKSSVKYIEQYGFQASAKQVISKYEKAACESTWEHFFPDKPVPYPLLLISAYDTMQTHLYKGCAEFEYGMKVYDTSVDSPIWKPILSDNYNKVGKIIKQGVEVLSYQKITAAAYAESCAFEVQFEGLNCIAINTDVKGSPQFESVYNADKHDAMLRFSYNNSQWDCSLYCFKKEVDIFSVCCKYGGGGHDTAVEFRCDTLPFI